MADERPRTWSSHAAGSPPQAGLVGHLCGPRSRRRFTQHARTRGAARRGRASRRSRWRYRWTEALPTAVPSFRRSPRIRSAPHRGLSRASAAISPPDLGADAGAARPRARPPPPAQAPPAAVPPADRVGGDRDRVPAPVAPDETGQHPDKLVTPAQPRALAGWAREDRRPVPQQDVVRDQVGSIAEGGAPLPAPPCSSRRRQNPRPAAPRRAPLGHAPRHEGGTRG